MRSPEELMLFVAIVGVVVLMALWTLARWRSGRHPPDPAARVLALLGLALLGGLVGLGRWGWIGERYGLAFWGPFGLAVIVFVADWWREAAARRRSG